MTDILDRLERQWAALDPVDEYRADARDAIEEIERLRAGREIGSRQIEQMFGEINRLRAELDALRGQSTEPMAWMHESGTLRLDKDMEPVRKGLDSWAPLFLATQPAIPEGWQLVPKEPTRQMLDAGHCDLTLEHGIDPMLKYAWSQMCDAAPQPGDAK